MSKNKSQGFTLIEVLLALSIIAIALTALLKAMGQNVDHTNRIKERTITHWVAMNAVAMVQLNLLHLNSTQETTQETKMLGERWFWRVKTKPTPLSSMQLISISVSKEPQGPFREVLSAFRIVP